MAGYVDRIHSKPVLRKTEVTGQIAAYTPGRLQEHRNAAIGQQAIGGRDQRLLQFSGLDQIPVDGFVQLLQFAQGLFRLRVLANQLVLHIKHAQPGIEAGPQLDRIDRL